ncbi:unnamed protein product [Rotaria socialis]|nr:unnamed protein product [Rotaria socialis]
MVTAPILLHCSAGIGRTGTFCAIDIGIKRYLNEKLIDMPTTVVKMRHERAGSVQTEDQYLFAHIALMDFIKQEKIIQEKVPSLELTNSKISFELDQIIELPPMNMPTIVTEQESVPDQIGISSDSSLPTVQEIIVSTNETNPETISLMPSTNDEEIDRKVCS